MSNQQEVERAVDQAFGPDVDRTVTVHSSGAVSIVVRAAHVVVIDGTAAHQPTQREDRGPER
ncbi:hypothetical protein [Kribbella sp. DT2]|uniref:hypothetical protein n=1 Tax=Kribbella sp. DT2 TaxID=3393427 RepID=UPI003CEE95B5